MPAAGAVPGLLQRIGGHQAKNDGLVELQAHLGQTLRDGVVDVVIVLGFPLNDDAEADNRVYFLVLGQQLGSQRQLERAGHRVAEDVLVLRPVPEQRFVGAGAEHVGQLPVPVGHHEPKPLLRNIGKRAGVVGAQVLQGSCHKSQMLRIKPQMTQIEG